MPPNQLSFNVFRRWWVFKRNRILFPAYGKRVQPPHGQRRYLPGISAVYTAKEGWWHATVPPYVPNAFKHSFEGMATSCHEPHAILVYETLCTNVYNNIKHITRKHPVSKTYIPKNLPICLNTTYLFRKKQPNFYSNLQKWKTLQKHLIFTEMPRCPWSATPQTLTSSQKKTLPGSKPLKQSVQWMEICDVQKFPII